MSGEMFGAVAAMIVLVFLAGSLLVSWKVSRGRPTLRDALRAGKEPRLSAMQPPLACPFYGQEMRPFRLVNRSGGAYPWCGSRWKHHQGVGLPARTWLPGWRSR
jgi:hypothetical protein